MSTAINKFGYREKIGTVSYNDEKKMFEEKYYQGETESVSYTQEYSTQERRSFIRNAAKKEIIINSLSDSRKQKRSILDLGCGEGFILDYFWKKNWEVIGIDLSEYGILMHNPHLRDYLYNGDCRQILEEIIRSEKRFDVINADCFIECYPGDLSELLVCVKSVMEKDSLLILRVANCTSPLHNELLRRGVLKEDIWFERIGNYAYFGKESLGHFLNDLGYECIEWYSDTFVDFNLINPVANYYDVEGIGKTCYKAMLDIEDIMENISLEKMVKLEKAMGDMGLGRHITCICKVRNE